MSDEQLHQRIGVDTDPEELTTLEEFRYWGELQRNERMESYQRERAVASELSAVSNLTDRFLGVLENVTARR